MLKVTITIEAEVVDEETLAALLTTIETTVPSSPY